MAEQRTWIAFATSGVIGGYDVLIMNDTITVLRDGTNVAQLRVRGLSRFVGTATDLRLGWATFADFEVVYVYDKADGNFGYAINLQIASYSEWGYAPFASQEDA